MIDAEEEGSPFKVPLRLQDAGSKLGEVSGGDVQGESDAVSSTQKPEMGPNCNLKSMFSSSDDIGCGEQLPSKSNGTTLPTGNTDRFQRLSALAEERKVNLFYLKDTILSKEATVLEKLDAMA